MIRRLSKLSIILLAVVGFGHDVVPAQDQLTDSPEATSPACATPATLQSKEQKKPEKPYAPPQLHQPASTPLLNQPGAIQSKFKPADISSTPHWNDAGSRLPLTNSPRSIIQPTAPSASPNTATIESGTKNLPDEHGFIVGGLDQPSDCVKMKFGDMDPCVTQCPPTCPTPFQRRFRRFNSCGPLRPLPPTPTQPSLFTPQFSPGIGYYPRHLVEQNPSVLNRGYPESAQLGDTSSQQTVASAAESQQSVSLNPSDGSEPGQYQGDHIIENASFRLPGLRQSMVENDSESRESLSAEPIVSTGITIHPPMIQPYNRNQHTFVVENRSATDVEDVVIEIDVPEDAKILAALPVNSVSTPQKAVFRFERIPAHDNVSIHLTAISQNETPIPFEANLISRSVYSFHVHGEQPGGALKNVSYTRNSLSAERDVQAIPGDDSCSGPVLVRNPFFQSLPQNQEASVPTNRHPTR